MTYCSEIHTVRTENTYVCMCVSVCVIVNFCIHKLTDNHLIILQADTQNYCLTNGGKLEHPHLQIKPPPNPLFQTRGLSVSSEAGNVKALCLLQPRESTTAQSQPAETQAIQTRQTHSGRWLMIRVLVTQTYRFDIELLCIKLR